MVCDSELTGPHHTVTCQVQSNSHNNVTRLEVVAVPQKGQPLLVILLISEETSDPNPTALRRITNIDCSAGLRADKMNL